MGHTTSCIDGCRYVWTGGPGRRDDLAFLGPFTPGGRGDGRPIWVTDLRDPAHPKTFADPIDLGRNDGLTDYSHDVDAQGFAWISGRGGLLGYATRGRWRDPRTPAAPRRTRPPPGMKILRLKGGPHASARLATVREPRARRDRLAAVPVRGLSGDSFVCPLFRAPSS